jgi:hypothetical protein
MKNFFEKLQGIKRPQKPEKRESLSGKVKDEIEFEKIKKRFEEFEERYKNLKTEIENVNVVEEAKKFFASFFKLREAYLKILNEFNKSQSPQKEKYRERIKEIESSIIDLVKKINIYIISYILTGNSRLTKYFFDKKSEEEKFKNIFKEKGFKLSSAKVVAPKLVLDNLFGEDENYERFFNDIENFWWNSNLGKIIDYLLKGLLSDKKGMKERFYNIKTKLRDVDYLLYEIRRILNRYENYLKTKSDHSIKTKIIVHKNIIAVFDKKNIKSLLDIFEKDLNQIENYLTTYRFNDINAEIERIKYLMDSIKL